jgi:hypothetical protein
MTKIAGSGSESGSIVVKGGSGSTPKCHGSATLLVRIPTASHCLLRSPRGTQSFLLLTRPKDRQASGILYSLTSSLKFWPHLFLIDAVAKPFELSSEFYNFFILHDNYLRVKSLQASALHFFGLSFFRSCDVDPALSPSHRCCGSGSGLDPDSRGSLNPDPDPGGQKLPRKT